MLILGVYLVSETRPRSKRRGRRRTLGSGRCLRGRTLPQFHTLSVIIPVYNERRTVMKLLQQVARQPLSLHKELIIVDDCSTDGTREFLQQTDLAKRLGGNGANTVKLVLHEKNRAKARAFALGLSTPPASWCSSRMPTWNTIPRDYPAADHAHSRGPRRRRLRQSLPRRTASRAALLPLHAEPRLLRWSATCSPV